MAELGQVNVSQGSRDDWHSITTLQTYTDPVVIVQPLSYNDPEPATVRLRQVGPQGFEFQVQEWDYLDGIHPLETVSYLIIEKGVHLLDSLVIEANAVETDSQFMNVALTWSFIYPNSPIILSQVQTINNNAAVTTRQKLIYNEYGHPRNFEVKLQEQEANQTPAIETIGYVILLEAKETMVTNSNYTNYYVTNSPSEVDHNWYGLNFPTSLVNLPDIEPTPTLALQTPYFFTNVQSINEDDASTLRYRQLNEEGVEVFVESNDPEHATEIVGIAAFMGIQLADGLDTPVAAAFQHLAESGEDVTSLDFKVGERDYQGQGAWTIRVIKKGGFGPVQINEDGSVFKGLTLGGSTLIYISKDTGEVLGRSDYQ